MKKLAGYFLAGLLLGGIAWVVWQLKWVLLGGCLLAVLGGMAYEKATGKKLSFLR